MKRKLILEDGFVLEGEGFGSLEDKMVELVFNTSMVGYQEILSDPSYTDQMVVMTYPLIGNYGMCADDYETDVPSLSGFVVREYCDTPSNFRNEKSLEEVMKQYNIVGLQQVDTRQLTRHIRNFGSCKAYIVDSETDTQEALAALRNHVFATDQVSRVSTKKVYTYSKPENPVYKIVVIDCGIKKNILRELAKKNLEIVVVPWNTTVETIQSLNPDGIFISNGPGDPKDVKETISTIKSCIGKYPIFGICLGHQIISLAYGADTYKLKFGHRGGNHPVKNLLSDSIEITSQNHSYAVDDQSLKNTPLQTTHINLLDNTIEGVACDKEHVFSVQYHPESAPGPQDSAYLFDTFMKHIQAFKEEQNHA
ncbi:MAG: glutamine-hydrolyzing carbamoyl-phosphate synthase small subunit [Firmicutes bacterium]|nr:glutamine-hydrolyzing carbamoyl-phosphate synthase small subunit [Bacillota bacterium]